MNPTSPTVLEDMGNVPLVSVDFFLKCALSPGGDTFSKQIKMSLIQKNIINRQNRWTCFPETPKASGKRETLAFNNLPTIFEDIVKEASSVLPNVEPRLHFTYKPNEAPASECRNDTRPDGQLELKDKKSLGEIVASLLFSPESRWEDVVLPFELKVDEKDYLDNVAKIVWSARQIMRNDPCRRFTFGITVENTQMRLWFFSRSHVMVTHPFNFIDEPDILIHVFTSLAFTDDEALGFDSTVSRVNIDGRIRYRSRVGDEFYISKKTLSDVAANFIRGRGTRVFEAYKESGPDRFVVLKDVWLEDDRILEGVLLERMRADMADLKANGTMFPGSKDPSAYFLTVMAHGRVKISTGKEDHTVDVMMRGVGLPSDVDYFPTSAPRLPILRSSRVLGSERSHSVGLTPEISSDMAEMMRANLPLDTPRFQARIHYRIVFNELGKSIHDVRRLSDMHQCLVDASIALNIMHILGYVHRDVSAGNILLFKGAGILGDLESAKRTTDLTTHEVRTGTNQYEPIEARMRAYLFRDDLDLSPGPPFKYNCIHDLESIWWIALWVLSHHTPLDDMEERRAQISAAATLFPSTGTSADRDYAFSKGHFQNIEPNLHPTFQDAVHQLIDVRRLLVTRYKLAEEGQSINETAFNGLHKELVAILEKSGGKFKDFQYKWAEREAPDDSLFDSPARKRSKVN